MAIISVSGYIGSGKDLVTKVIQYLDFKEKIGDEDYSNFENIHDKHGFRLILTETSWENKKWADALKEVASLLTGIPRADFEKIEVKNSCLGPEWYYYKISNNERIFDEKFLTLKEAEDYIENNLFGMNLEPVLWKMTVRELLQRCGTEAMRHGLHQNVWVNALMSKYKIKEETVYSGDGIKTYNDYPNWIISDTRFYNELNAVKSKGGICIRVNRDDNKTTSTHPSERELDDAEFDYVIQNNTGEIQKLIYDVREILIKEKLLSAS